MAEWAYMVISTSIEADNSPDTTLDMTCDTLIAQIRDAGMQGWETVGGMDFRVRRRRNSDSSSLNLPALLFKWPKSPPANS